MLSGLSAPNLVLFSTLDLRYSLWFPEKLIRPGNPPPGEGSMGKACAHVATYPTSAPYISTWQL